MNQKVSLTLRSCELFQAFDQYTCRLVQGLESLLIVREAVLEKLSVIKEFICITWLIQSVLCAVICQVVMSFAMECIACGLIH